MKLRRLYTLGVVLTMLVSMPRPVCSQTSDTYVVKPGDTLFQIARAHDLTVQELRELNDLDGNTIRAGRVLRIRREETLVGWNRPERQRDGEIRDSEEPRDPPDAVPSDSVQQDPDTTGTAVYVVKEGDTLFSMAARLNMPIDSLARMNGVLNGVLVAGTRLRIPLEKTVQRYLVRRGDTLYDLSRGFGIRLADLKAANGLRDSNLRVGQMLHIPGQGVREAADERDLLPDAKETAIAIVYPITFISRITASGRQYDPARYTISHPKLDLGTIVLVTVPGTGAETFAEVADRGFFSDPTLIDVSESVARVLNIDLLDGTTVEIRIIEGTSR